MKLKLFKMLSYAPVKPAYFIVSFTRKMPFASVVFSKEHLLLILRVNSSARVAFLWNVGFSNVSSWEADSSLQRADVYFWGGYWFASRSGNQMHYQAFFSGLYSMGRMSILHLRTSIPHKKGRVIYLTKCSNQNIEGTAVCVATLNMQVLTFYLVSPSEKLSIGLKLTDDTS